jgi:hypothetical protein
VSDPEKLLKPKGISNDCCIKGKVYQPRVTQVNAKVQTEELTPKESFKQIHSAEASTSEPEAKLENPEVIVPEIKIEIDLPDTFTSKNKGSLSIPVVINDLSILSFPKKRLMFPKTLKSIFYTQIPLLSSPYIYIR